MSNLEKDYDYLLKILLIGDSGVGKSSLMLKFCDDKMDEPYISTIGVDFRIKTLNINNKIYKLQIWDTAGQERFRSITTSYYRGAQGIIMVYDISDRNSFYNIGTWLNEIEKYGAENVCKFIIGTKNDLKRQVDKEDAKSYASMVNCEFYETSARNGININDIFTKICINIRENHFGNDFIPNKSTPVTLPNANVIKETSCCQ